MSSFGSFGQTQSTNQGAFGGGTTPATSGFGGTAPATAFGSAGFGAPSQNAPKTVGFGASAAPGGFGTSSTAQPSAFGGGAASGATNAFGSATTPAVGGFGGATTTPATGAFGTSSGFGAVSAPAPMSSGLGTQPASSMTGFGSTPSTTGGGGAFGSATTGTGFGGATPGGASSSFGGNNLNVGMGMGMGIGMGVGQQSQSVSMPQGRDGFEGELSRIADIKKQYAPIQLSGDGNPHGLNDIDANLNSNRPTQGPFPWNEDSAFKFTIYPPKDPAGRYLQFRDEYLDSVAIERNPDPDRLVPRTLMGSTELLNRYKSQNSESARMVSELEKVKSTQIGPIRHEQSQLSVKFRHYKNKHNEQARRLTKLLRDIEVLRNRGRPLHNDEIKHREEYDRAIVVKNGFEGKLAQLDGLTQAYSKDVSDNLENECYEDISDLDLHAIFALLSKQHEGLSHLTSILERDLRDTEIMARSLK